MKLLFSSPIKKLEIDCYYSLSTWGLGIRLQLFRDGFTFFLVFGPLELIVEW